MLGESVKLTHSPYYKSLCQNAFPGVRRTFSRRNSAYVSKVTCQPTDTLHCYDGCRGKFIYGLLRITVACYDPNKFLNMIAVTYPAPLRDTTRVDMGTTSA